MSFTIDGLPKTTNAQSSMHWSAKHRMAREWQMKTFAEIMKQKPANPLKYASLTCTRHSATSPDYDGLVSSFKHVIDSLILFEIIEDDSMSNIGMPFFLWKKSPRGKGFIEVEVTEKASLD